MVQSYRAITPEMALQIRLAMADVDGTLLASGDSVNSAVAEVIRCLEEQGIMVGLVSGRTLTSLESLAGDLGITGPIIAENGGVAKLAVGSELLDLGYSRRPALQTLGKLKALFPNAIKEREDNKDRLVDVVIWALGLEPDELRQHLGSTQLLDSGYILHLMQEGVSKGKTLERLLSEIGDGSLTPAEVFVFGDSTTDISLFRLFPHSALIYNPRLPVEQRQVLQEVARFAGELPFGDGFAEVASHVLNARLKYGTSTAQH